MVSIDCAASITLMRSGVAARWRATRVHKQPFGCGALRLVLRAVPQGVADFLADRGAARLAHHLDHLIAFSEPCGQQLDLCRFAAALGAFESDEDAVHGFWPARRTRRSIQTFPDQLPEVISDLFRSHNEAALSPLPGLCRSILPHP